MINKNTKLINTNFPNAIHIDYLPTKQPTTLSLSEPNNINNLNYSISPKNSWDDDSYCNILPSSPRNQLIEYPINKCSNNLKKKIINSNKPVCKQVYNSMQNVKSEVCNYSDNMNYARGNEFGVNYKIKYNIKKPRNIPNKLKLYKKKTEVVVDSPFYPYPNYLNTKNKNYKTYPYPKHYNKEGLPIYNKSSDKKYETEHFQGDYSKVCNYKILGVTCIILILIMIILATK